MGCAMRARLLVGEPPEPGRASRVPAAAPGAAGAVPGLRAAAAPSADAPHAAPAGAL